MKLLLVALLAFASPVLAADVWVLRGGVGPCDGVVWELDDLFYNGGNATATVRLLGVSDGPDEAIARALDLPPRQVVSLRNATTEWRPSRDLPMWMLHLDVPDGVNVESVLNVGIGNCTMIPSPDNAALYGTTHVPVFRALVPAGLEQVHIGTSLGGAPARNNVGMFNAGTSPAAVNIELRRACDDLLLDSTTAVVPANSTAQFRLQAPEPASGCTAAHRAVQPWVEYVTVTADQPGTSWVSSLRNGVPPRVDVSIH